MYLNVKFYTMILLLAVILFFQACASKPIHLPSEQLVLYSNNDKMDLINKYMPGFLVENHNVDYNKISTVRARLDSNKEEIYMDMNKASVYTQVRKFKTKNALYTNLIYRVHFKETPHEYLTYGKNIGLFIIITLDVNNEPLLYTTVHTCGCYLAFIPTGNMKQSFYPNNWSNQLQYIYGESLPSIIEYKNDSLLTFLLRKDTHRIKDVLMLSKKNINRYYKITLENKPLNSLENIVINNNKSISFFESNGVRKDYVKNSFKPWEKLFISWLAFDLKVGEDKRLGVNKADGVSFYTSLKPWAQDASDMRDFASFLRYWGWKL